MKKIENLTAHEMRKALAGNKKTEKGDLLQSVDVREFARLTGIVQYMAKALALGANSRLLLDAVIFLGDGDARKQIELSNLQLGFYLRTEQKIRTSLNCQPRKGSKGNWILVGVGKQITQESLEKWVGRVKKQLVAEQERAGIVLVEMANGGQDTEGRNYSTQYRVVAYEYIEEIQEALSFMSLADGEVEKQIQLAVLSVLDGQRLNIIPKEEKEKTNKIKKEDAWKRDLNIALAWINRAYIGAYAVGTKEFSEIDFVATQIEDRNADLFSTYRKLKNVA